MPRLTHSQLSKIFATHCLMPLPNFYGCRPSISRSVCESKNEKRRPAKCCRRRDGTLLPGASWIAFGGPSSATDSALWIMDRISRSKPARRNRWAGLDGRSGITSFRRGVSQNDSTAGNKHRRHGGRSCRAEEKIVNLASADFGTLNNLFRRQGLRELQPARDVAMANGDVSEPTLVRA